MPVRPGARRRSAAAPRPRTRCADRRPLTASCTTLRSNGVIGSSFTGSPELFTSSAALAPSSRELLALLGTEAARCPASGGCGHRSHGGRRDASAPGAPPAPHRRGRRASADHGRRVADDRDSGPVGLDVHVDVAVEVGDVEQTLEVVRRDLALLLEAGQGVAAPRRRRWWWCLPSRDGLLLTSWTGAWAAAGPCAAVPTWLGVRDRTRRACHRPAWPWGRRPRARPASSPATSSVVGGAVRLRSRLAAAWRRSGACDLLWRLGCCRFGAPGHRRAVLGLGGTAASLFTTVPSAWAARPALLRPLMNLRSNSLRSRPLATIALMMFVLPRPRTFLVCVTLLLQALQERGLGLGARGGVPADHEHLLTHGPHVGGQPVDEDTDGEVDAEDGEHDREDVHQHLLLLHERRLDRQVDVLRHQLALREELRRRHHHDHDRGDDADVGQRGAERLRPSPRCP